MRNALEEGESDNFLFPCVLEWDACQQSWHNRVEHIAFCIAHPPHPLGAFHSCMCAAIGSWLHGASETCFTKFLTNVTVVIKA